MRHFKILILVATGLAAGCTEATDCAEDSLECVLSAYEQDKHGDLQSVVVIKDGKWVAERYYNGSDENTLVDVRSAGKSVTSILMGIALDRGLIESLDDPVSTYWPEAATSAAGPVKLADILTMRSGLHADADDPTSPGYENHMDEADNPLAVALSVPRLEAPGTQYRYNSHAAYIAGIVVGRAAGGGMEPFAREVLFTPLGITRWDWQEDNSGITKGQGNLFLTARGFAKIGEMMLNKGIYGGQQIVSRQWVEDSLTPKVDISASTSGAGGYGYYWYQDRYPVNGRQVELFFASGNGGNKIYIVPEFNLMVSVMATGYGQGRSHRRSNAILRDILALQ